MAISDLLTYIRRLAHNWMKDILKATQYYREYLGVESIHERPLKEALTQRGRVEWYIE